ncbi:MAG TPA: hypothetical protein VL147_09315, partial [Devosia sp.]|nr:hypothetical protein [Devosia sp.]
MPRQTCLVRFATAAVVTVVLAVSPVMAQQVTDYLGVPGPIAFDGTDYLLAWSSQPTPQYTKQEYVPVGQTPESYGSMVMVEFLAADMTPAAMANAQVDLLNQRKQTDPLVNMNLIQNEGTGEVILDFIVSSKDADGEYIVEWNAYRYASTETGEGQAGGMLFAISHRA